MFSWWQELDSVIALNGWMQTITFIGVLLTIVSLLLLWIYGNKMIGVLIERERKASQKISAVEKAAEQIRRELLSTQQNQDIADQKRQLAEMDADSLRKELEQSRKRYSEAENALKDRIGELRNLHITHSGQSSTTAGITDSGSTAKAAEMVKSALDAQQRKMLTKLLASGPKGELDIISILDDSMSLSMAKELQKLLKDQGWTSKDIVQSSFSNPPDGLVLVVHSKQTAPSYAKFLQRTFTTIGLSISAQINDKYPEWSISLIVGKMDT
jgi:hypothetical protein